MTIDEWLESRQPRPPAPLMERLKAAIGSSVTDDASHAASVLLMTAEQELRELVGGGEIGRPIAIDLLTVDALTTYALESTTEMLESLAAFSDEAMARFGKILP